MHGALIALTALLLQRIACQKGFSPPCGARIVGLPTIALSALQNLCKTLMEF
jgi:hypothetical protein